MMYKSMATGLSPEIIKVGDKDFYVSNNDRHNLLRPETIESFFYLWRITKDVKYRKWGWEVFNSFSEYARIETGGYSSIRDVTTTTDITYRDHMESFWLAET